LDCTAPLSPCKGRLISFGYDDDDDDDETICIPAPLIRLRFGFRYTILRKKGATFVNRKHKTSGKIKDEQKTQRKSQQLTLTH